MLFHVVTIIGPRFNFQKQLGISPSPLFWHRIFICEQQFDENVSLLIFGINYCPNKLWRNSSGVLIPIDKNSNRINNYNSFYNTIRMTYILRHRSSYSCESRRSYQAFETSRTLSGHVLTIKLAMTKLNEFLHRRAVYIFPETLRRGKWYNSRIRPNRYRLMEYIAKVLDEMNIAI